MFGELLKKLRLENELTQAQLGKLIQVSPSTIGMYEQNRRSPSIDVLVQISKILNYPLDELCTSVNNTPLIMPIPALKKDSSSQSLSIKEKKDIAKDLEKFKNELLNSDELMFDGHPMSEDSINNILSALEIGMEQVRRKNKVKYNPHKNTKPL